LPEASIVTSDDTGAENADEQPVVIDDSNELSALKVLSTKKKVQEDDQTKGGTKKNKTKFLTKSQKIKRKKRKNKTIRI
jgi:hypothetical protein